MSGTRLDPVTDNIEVLFFTSRMFRKVPVCMPDAARGPSMQNLFKPPRQLMPCTEPSVIVPTISEAGEGRQHREAEVPHSLLAAHLNVRNFLLTILQ